MVCEHNSYMRCYSAHVSFAVQPRGQTQRITKDGSMRAYYKHSSFLLVKYYNSLTKSHCHKCCYYEYTHWWMVCILHQHLLHGDSQEYESTNYILRVLTQFQCIQPRSVILELYPSHSMHQVEQ